MASAPAGHRRSISPKPTDTNPRCAPPIPPKPHGRRKDDDIYQSQEPSFKKSDTVEDGLYFTVKCLEEAMRQPNMYVLGLQQMLATVYTHTDIQQQLNDAHAQNKTLQTTIEEHQRRQDNAISLNEALQDAKETIQREKETSTRRDDELKTLKQEQLKMEAAIQKQVAEYEDTIDALKSELKTLEISYKHNLDELIAQQKERMTNEQATTLKEFEDKFENLNKKLNALTQVNVLQTEMNTEISAQLQQKSVELETFQKHDAEVLSKIRTIVSTTCGIPYTGLESTNTTNVTELTNTREEILTKLTDTLRQTSALSLDDEGKSMLQHVLVHLKAEIQTLKFELENRKHAQMTAEEFADSQIDYLEQQIQKQRNDQLVAESFANEEITKLEDEIDERKRTQITVEVFAESQLQRLEFQLQEQRAKRTFVEKYTSIDIRKLEDAIEDRKRSLKLAETFAETEISTLETKLEKKESTLRLVQRFTDAEITRLEDEVDECLYLKDVLEAEAATLRRELTDLQQKDVVEDDSSRTQLTTALTALDGLQNTVSCLQTRVKELETINTKDKEDYNTQLSKYIGTQLRADEVQLLKQRVREEEMKKMQAVNKLAEIMNRSSFRTSSTSVSPVELRKKERELIQEKQRLSTEREQFDMQINRFQEKMAETQNSLEKSEESNTLLQMRLDAKESEIDELKSTTSMSQGSRKHMIDWLRVSTFDWNKLFVVVSLRHMLFFKTPEEKQRAEPVLVIDLVSIQGARNSTKDEARELKTKDLSSIFVLLYNIAGEKVHGQVVDQEKKSSEFHEYKGHKFQDVVFRSPNTCDACKKSMWGMLQPPPAIRCTQCNTKVHIYHCDNDDGVVEPCPRIPIAGDADKSNLRILLLEAESPDMKEAWVSHIMDKVLHPFESNMLDVVQPTQHPLVRQGSSEL